MQLSVSAISLMKAKLKEICGHLMNSAIIFKNYTEEMYLRPNFGHRSANMSPVV